MKKIAILGATGYIGYSLAQEFLARNEEDLFLFSRSVEKLKERFSSEEGARFFQLDSFHDHFYDVIINASGIGDPKLVAYNSNEVFLVTEQIDTLILAYLKEHTETQYINLSSGAVYGKNAASPVDDKTDIVISANPEKPHEFYSVAKIHAEARHRAESNLNIVDLRVFAFFSQYVDPSSSFLLSEITDCLLQKKVFMTRKADIVRDVITPADLTALIIKIIGSGKRNCVYDVYSKKPLSKFELLESMKREFGLSYSIKDESLSDVSGPKNSYYSLSRKAELELGYSPSLSSLEGVIQELKKRGL